MHKIKIKNYNLIKQIWRALPNSLKMENIGVGEKEKNNIIKGPGRNI